MRRLGILALKQKHYATRGSVLTLLRCAAEHLTELVVVSKDGAEVDEQICPRTTTVRYAFKFNCYAYKRGLVHVGWARLDTFDEILFFNDSFFVIPELLERAILEMENRGELDFWGLTEVGPTSITPHSKCPYDVRPEYVQQYFFAVRKSMFKSEHFQRYWEHLPMFRTEEEVVDCIEAVFTYTFSQLGFEWGTFVDTSDWLSDDPKNNFDLSTYCAYDLMTEHGMPVIRKKTFLAQFGDFLMYSSQETPRQVFRLLQEGHVDTLKDVIQWLSAEVDGQQAEALLGQVNVVPDNYGDFKLEAGSAALIAYIRDAGSLRYLHDLPAEVDLYVISECVSCEDVLHARNGTGKSMLVLADGSLEEALVSCAQGWVFPRPYELVGFVSDCVPRDDVYVTARKDYIRMQFESIAMSAAFVRNVARLFSDNLALGLVRPQEMNFDGFFYHKRGLSKGERARLRRALRSTNLDFVLDDSCRRMSSATAFWCRTQLLESTIACMQGRRRPMAGPSAWQLLPYVAHVMGYRSEFIATRAHVEAGILNDSTRLGAISLSIGRFGSVRFDRYFSPFVNDVRAYKRKTDYLGKESSAAIRRLQYVRESDNDDKKVLAPSMSTIQRRAYDFVASSAFNEGLALQWRSSKRFGTLFSPPRTNVIEWLPFSENDTVLEVGGGYGAYAHFLADRVNTVTVVEPDPARAYILKERCRRCHNLIVLEQGAENLLESMNEHVDWAIVHNLENLFSDRGDAEAFLRGLAAKDTIDTIALLCNNSKGYRYATESRFFETGERDCNATKIDLRFTREEVEGFFDGSPHASTLFYYPYPDYVFCRSLYSDSFLPSPAAMLEDAWRVPSQRLQTEGEKEFYKNVVLSGEFSERVNTYLVIASKNDDIETCPSFISYPSDKKPQFGLVTSMYDDGTVHRCCVDPSARGHIAQIKRLTDSLRTLLARAEICLNYINYTRDGLSYSLAEGENLHNRLATYAAREEFDVVKAEILEYCGRLRRSYANGYFASSAEFGQVFGNVKLPIGLLCGAVTSIDMNLDNITIGDDGQYHIIDCEWLFDFPIPVDFVIWRAIFYFFIKMKAHRSTALAQLRRACLEANGIDSTLQRLFKKMEDNFQNYVGA